MTDRERINKLLISLEITAKQLASDLGFNRADVIYNILNEKNGISRNLANRIVKKYPQFNLEWILKGTGVMTIPRVKQIVDNHHEAGTLNDSGVLYGNKLDNILVTIQEKDKQIAFLSDIIVSKDRDVVFLQELIKEKFTK